VSYKAWLPKPFLYHSLTQFQRYNSPSSGNIPAKDRKKKLPIFELVFMWSYAKLDGEISPFVPPFKFRRRVLTNYQKVELYRFS
jgi:hypothetical protein